MLGRHTNALQEQRRELDRLIHTTWTKEDGISRKRVHARKLQYDLEKAHRPLTRCFKVASSRLPWREGHRAAAPCLPRPSVRLQQVTPLPFLLPAHPSHTGVQCGVLVGLCGGLSGHGQGPRHTHTATASAGGCQCNRRGQWVHHSHLHIPPCFPRAPRWQWRRLVRLIVIMIQ